MQALLLNSGIGKRMGAATFDKPKCMVEIGDGDTIISRQVRALHRQGIKDLIITTGPFDSLLRDYLACNFPCSSFTFIQNQKYATTNYIYSMLLAEEALKDDFVLLHGDLVFAESLLADTLSSFHTDTVLVGYDAPLPEKDFKARLQDGYVREISIDINGPDCRFLIPLYKVSRPLWRRWLAAMKKFAANNRLNVYAESALNPVLTAYNLCPVYFYGELCAEIDNPSDLKTVRAALSSQ